MDRLPRERDPQRAPALGRLIRTRRREAGIKRKDIAAFVGVAPTTYGSWEDGPTFEPPHDVWDRIARYITERGDGVRLTVREMVAAAGIRLDQDDDLIRRARGE